MIKDELHLEGKENFGKTLLYAKCEQANIFSTLMQMNKKIFSDEAIYLLKQLGFQIYIHNSRKNKKTNLGVVSAFTSHSKEKE